jgi:hypothetical protein
MATTTNNGWATPDDTSLVKDGASAIRTLGSAIDTSVGTGLLAWTAYTPTFTNLTVGNGTLNFAYAKLGKTVFVRGVFTFGSTSSVTGVGVNISIPVASNAGISTNHIFGFVGFFKPGTNSVVGSGAYATSTTVQLRPSVSSGAYVEMTNMSSTVPFTWASATGDNLKINFTYEAA